MSIKLKVLGLGLLAVMATSAFAVVNASATSNGHFTAEPTEDHITIRGVETVNTLHRLKFYEIKDEVGHPTSNPNNWIECTHASYHGTLEGAAATTTTSVKVRPHYTQCRTAAEANGTHDVEIHVPSTCGTNVFEFTSGGTGTVHLNCTITITHPNCDIRVTSGALTASNRNMPGVTYTTTVENSKHALTMNVNVKTIHGEFHNGLCVFLGTDHLFEMVGSVTVWGENTDGSRAGITHT